MPPAIEERLRFLAWLDREALCRQVEAWPNDLAARYGGEEFAIILPSAGQEQAARIANKLKAKIRGMAILHAGGDKGVVTVSIGVATQDEFSVTDTATIVSQADEALYYAKVSGRDLVMSWQQPALSKAQV